MLKITDSICTSYRENNEDFILTNEGLVLVLDGSTNLGMYGDAPDASWYVRAFAEEFERCFDGDPKKASEQAIDLLSRQYYEKTGVNPNDTSALPSASFICLYEQENRLTLALLGDCSAVIYKKSGEALLFSQDSVKKLDGKVLALMKKISEERGIPLSEAVKQPEVSRLLQHNRSLMNTPGGYKIMSFCKAALDGMELFLFEKSEVSHALLFTDGFDSAKELFLNGLPQKSLHELYGEIFSAEEEDSSFTLYPRFKLHDDASCVLAEIV